MRGRSLVASLLMGVSFSVYSVTNAPARCCVHIIIVAPIS
jgi:hypothetical protein